MTTIIHHDDCLIHDTGPRNPECTQRISAAVGGLEDAHYETAGARILNSAQSVYDNAEMIVKVKEPQAVERAMLREEQTLFTYLHLAPDPEQTKDLVQCGATCIAYETVTDDHGRLPLLAPMSEVAGRLSIQAGAWCLEKARGGSGVLLGGVPGVEPAKVRAASPSRVKMETPLP